MKIYTIPGNPVALARAIPAYSSRHMWDSQKHLKFTAGLAIRHQHEAAGLPPFKGALRANVIFFMPFPNKASRKCRESLEMKPHFVRPDLDNLEKFLFDVCTQTEIMFKDDCQIVQINALKMYAESEGEPRTLFTLQEVQAFPFLPWLEFLTDEA